MNVRECHGMIIFEGREKETGTPFSCGIAKNRIRYIYPNSDWSSDFVPEWDFENKIKIAGKETCFLLVVEGLISGLENIEFCFISRYIENEKATYYHFCRNGEEALMTFYGFPSSISTAMRMIGADGSHQSQLVESPEPSDRQLDRTEDNIPF